MSGPNDADGDALGAQVRDALSRLDGTDATAVEVMTGLSAADIDELGGLPR